MVSSDKVFAHFPITSLKIKTTSLAIVNSLFYSFETEIETITHTLAIVGTESLTELVLATSVMDQFTDIPKHLVSQWILFGSQLLKGWGLPMSLCEPVFFHHRPEQAKDFPLITQIVHVADSIVDELKLGDQRGSCCKPC